jgi:hypothetical protein
MSVTWIEVADTATKIGLGALISGAAAYMLAKLSHKQNISKELVTKKTSILEEICELAEEFFYFGTALHNIVGGFTRAGPNDIYQTAHQRAVLAAHHEKFFPALQARNKAIAKARLLKLPAAADALLEYNEGLVEYREIVAFSGRLPTTEEQEANYERTVATRNAFYVVVSDYLESLG